jgi:hypothetical protein
MPQHVEIGGLREHTIDPAAAYEITLHGAPPAGLTARFFRRWSSTCYRRLRFSLVGWLLPRR